MSDKKTPAQLAAEAQAAQDAAKNTGKKSTGKKTDGTATAQKKTPEQIKAEAAEKAKLKASEKAAEKAEKLKKDIADGVVTASGLVESIVATTTKAENILASSVSGDGVTIEILEAAQAEATDLLKAAKTDLSELKKLGRKFKDSEEVTAKVISGETSVDGLVAILGSVKEKRAEVKKAQAAAEKEEAQKLREASKMPMQNDVRRPKPDTACGKVWELIDAITAKLGQAAPVAYVLREGEARGFDVNTLKTQYARWKKFNGIEGRVAAPVIPLDL